MPEWMQRILEQLGRSPAVDYGGRAGSAARVASKSAVRGIQGTQAWEQAWLAARDAAARGASGAQAFRAGATSPANIATKAAAQHAVEAARLPAAGGAGAALGGASAFIAPAALAAVLYGVTRPGPQAAFRRAGANIYDIVAGQGSPVPVPRVINQKATERNQRLRSVMQPGPSLNRKKIVVRAKRHGKSRIT